MKYPFLLSMASLESPSWSGSAETIVKILHIYPVPRVLEIWQSAALTYKKANPAVKIEFDYLENEEFKAKLPTLLRSDDRPSLFHSWGGGVMREQVQAGVCQDITNAIDEDFKDSFYPAGVQAFIVEGKSYGLPDSVGPIVFLYNKEVCEKANVDPSAIKYWENLLDAVQKCKAAGVIPIVVGGSEKWPLQFYPALLMMRVLGKDGMASAYRGDNGGFAGPDVVKAWKLYKELCDLDCFQEGFLTMNTRDAVAFFHDGKAAFHLHVGTWVLTAGRLYAADKNGLPEAKLGWFFFPEVHGGQGKANDIFGSVYGWLVSKDAPKETLDFMKIWLGKETQTKLAAEGLSIPMVKGTAEAIQSPFYKALAVEVDRSGWICVAMDQLLGRQTGRIFNDETAAVAAGAQSPEQATQVIEHSWSRNRI
jgi:raffinose/stachyose/melibiose transport system substrate-binding protein